MPVVERIVKKSARINTNGHDDESRKRKLSYLREKKEKEQKIRKKRQPFTVNALESGKNQPGEFLNIGLIFDSTKVGTGDCLSGSVAQGVNDDEKVRCLHYALPRRFRTLITDILASEVTA